MPSPSGHRVTVNQNTQIGLESTPGTSVAANRLLEMFSVKFGIKATVNTFRAQGRKHPSVAVENAEMTEGEFSGELDYNGMPYLLHMLIGGVSLAAHTPSVTAYDWGPISPALSGNYSPKTMTIEHGDSIRAEKATYGLFTGLSYSLERKQPLQVSAPFMAQKATDGITLTASPTIVALLPSVGAHYTTYIDSTSGGIGGTAQSNLMKLSYDASDYYTQFWPLVRANASWSSQIDMAPKKEVKFTLEADSTGMGHLTNYLQVGATAYIRVDGSGQLIDVGNSVAAAFRHDMAVKLTDIADLSDADGVYAVEYTGVVVEDASWSSGTAEKFSGTCSLSSL